MDPLTIGLALATKYLPDLIKKFGGNDLTASVAGKVVELAQSVTGEPTAEAAVRELDANPTAALDFQRAVMLNETELIRLYLTDTQDARKMQVAALGQEDLFSKRFVYYFASVWSLFAMIYFAAVTFLPVPASGQRVSDTILGVLISTVMGCIFGYLYGSTKGSLAKTQMLASK